MNINAINFNFVQKTNFGLMTDQARERLNSLINKENSGMDEDGRIKLTYLETSPDFILHYDSECRSLKFYSIYKRAAVLINQSTNNIGNFLRNLFTESQALMDVEKTAAKREKPLTLDYFNKK